MQGGVVQTVGSSVTVTVTLQVGAVAQQVEGRGGAPLVETQNTNMGHLTESERVLEWPLDGQQPTDWIIQFAVKYVFSGCVGSGA